MTDDPALSVTKFCRSGTVTIDAGANLGRYSAALLDVEGSRVVAFEPVRSTFLSLCSRISAINGGRLPDNFFPYNVALGAATATATITLPVLDKTTVHEWASLVKDFDELAERSGAKSIPTVRHSVIVIPLDSFCTQEWFYPVTFLKIDVEGSELEVLQGAQETISASKPVIFAELEERHRPGSTKHVPEFLFARGYCGFFLYKGKVGSFDQFDPKTMHSAGLMPDDTRYSDPYINDFLFIHQDDTWALSQLAHFERMPP